MHPKCKEAGNGGMSQPGKASLGSMREGLVNLWKHQSARASEGWSVIWKEELVSQDEGRSVSQDVEGLVRQDERS